MYLFSRSTILTALTVLFFSALASGQTNVTLGQQCDCNDGAGPWTNTNNTAATTSSSQIRFLGQRVGVGANPVATLQLRNVVGSDNTAGTSSFSNFTDYQVLLYKGGSPTTSYGLGIEAGTMALNSNGAYDWNIKGNDEMTLTTAGLGIGVNNPVTALQFDNSYGNDASFDSYTDYKVLLWKSGIPQQSYGLGIEGATLAFNSYRDFDWNIQGTDKMILTPAGLGVGVNPEATLHLGNNVGIDNGSGTNSFDVYADYQVLLYRGGTAKNSYGLGIENGTLALNSNGGYDWNIVGNDRMSLTNGGLSVKGNITATGTITPDYVFEQYFEGASELNPTYRMMDLAAVKAFTAAHKHLPGVPSAAEVAAQGGIVLNRQSEIHLEKIEELFLHTIEQEEKIEALKAENAALQARLERIEAALLERE